MGRVHLLQEALYSFLIQDYPDKEMIIVNDCPFQKLEFDHPQVKIYNETPFKTIGEKENFAIERCNGDIIITGDDDDISLPWHIDNINKWWKEDTNILFWENAAYYNEPDITAITQVGNSGFTFSKKAWEKVGKSPIMNAGGDMEFTNKVRTLGNVVNAHPENKEISWFYRWSLPQCYHQSGMGTDTSDRKNVVERNAEYIQTQLLLDKIPHGVIKLKPAWRHDYIKMLDNFIKK